MKRMFLSITLLLAILMSACSQVKTNEPTEAGELGYPAQGSLEPTDLGYPAPISLPTMRSGETPKSPIDTPKPETGKAALSGVLYSYTINSVIPGTPIYLTPAIGENKDQVPLALVGPQESRGDIIGTTDENGYILMNNLPPGNYYLVVWAPLNWSVVETADKNQTPLMIVLKSDESLNLDVAYVSWP